MQLKSTAYATFHWNRTPVMGIVLDISPEGLSFKYLPLENNEPAEEADTQEEFKVDLFTQDKKIFISGLSCKLVYNILHPRKYRMSQLQMNRGALQFLDLDPEQGEKLLEALKENGFLK